ncbi:MULTISPECIES: CocE/NonD family hydrolase [unclassified Paenibacillus]|uniref:CocE/NonD family hydrolase n=1 Tax=unclassified Paenibacillus TaxID=185978 RepID=UPI0021194DEF|nr:MULTISPECIES: CocE/NonD family hydrolase [unclassified Paenibacillus]
MARCGESPASLDLHYAGHDRLRFLSRQNIQERGLRTCLYTVLGAVRCPGYGAAKGADRLGRNVTLELYASTSAEDTDFVAKLVDVYPDGRAYNIAEGIIRASYRNGLERPEPVPPDGIVKYEISLGPTAVVFQQGHSIRLDITSSLFPTYDRNPNRLMNPGEVTEADFVTATQTIHHDGRRPSRIWLPILRE